MTLGTWLRLPMPFSSSTANVAVRLAVSACALPAYRGPDNNAAAIVLSGVSKGPAPMTIKIKSNKR